jgi:hypothetical protein
MIYFWNILIAVDQLGNTLFGGDPQETISSRADKAMKSGKKWGCLLCRFLSLIQKDHCQKSVEQNVGSNGVIPD